LFLIFELVICFTRCWDNGTEKSMVNRVNAGSGDALGGW